MDGLDFETIFVDEPHGLFNLMSCTAVVDMKAHSRLAKAEQWIHDPVNKIVRGYDTHQVAIIYYG